VPLKFPQLEDGDGAVGLGLLSTEPGSGFDDAAEGDGALVLDPTTSVFSQDPMPGSMTQRLGLWA